MKTEMKLSPGEYSCLKVVLVFKREFSYYLLTIYVPSCMLVIVSWVRYVILVSDWLITSISHSDWLIISILHSDWSIAQFLA